MLTTHSIIFLMDFLVTCKVICCSNYVSPFSSLYSFLSLSYIHKDGANTWIELMSGIIFTAVRRSITGTLLILLQVVLNPASEYSMKQQTTYHYRITYHNPYVSQTRTCKGYYIFNVYHERTSAMHKNKQTNKITLIAGRNSIL